jgi:hypothetical protein
MIGTSSAFTVNLRMRRFFLDRVEVERRIGQRKARALNRGGTFVRQNARKLLGKPSSNKRRLPRPAGKPPRVWTQDERATLRNILYHYNAGSDSVIIGPVHLNQVQQQAVELGAITVPQIHEFGGPVIIREVSDDRGRTWHRRNLRRTLRTWERARERRAHYPKRPFMAPALQNTLRRVPDLFGSTSIGEAA